jgi:hypothetical protein
MRIASTPAVGTLHMHIGEGGADVTNVDMRDESTDRSSPLPRSLPAVALFASSSTIYDDAEGAAALNTLQHAQHDGGGASGALRATMVDGDTSTLSLAVAHAASPLSADTVSHSASKYTNSPTTQAMVQGGYKGAAGSGAATGGDGSVASGGLDTAPAATAAALFCLSTHAVVDTLASSSRVALSTLYGGASAYEDDKKTGPQPIGASMPRTTAQERMLQRMCLLLAPRPRSTNNTSNSASSTHIGDARIGAQSKKASLLNSVCNCLTVDVARLAGVADAAARYAAAMAATGDQSQY